MCFTQILSGRAHWMRNSILRPMSTHTAYFWWTRYPKNKKYLKKHDDDFWRTSLPQKQEIPEKRDDDVIITFFQVFLVFGASGPSKVCHVGTRWMWNQILHPTSSPDQNLSKNTGRYVENTNTKSSFFLSSSKINQYYFIILTIILLF